MRQDISELHNVSKVSYFFFNLYVKHTNRNRKFISCSYEENPSQHEIRTLRSQLECLSNGLNIPSGPSPTQLTLDSTTQYYPIPSQWYMPFLVNHCKLFLDYTTLRNLSKLTFSLIMTCVSRGLPESTSITLMNIQGINGCKPHSQIRACFTAFFLLHRPIWKWSEGRVATL